MRNEIDANRPLSVDDAGPHSSGKDAARSDSRAASAAEGAATPRERILIFRIGSLGDTVIALPCFHKLAAAFPGAERHVLTNVPVSRKAASLELILGGSGLIHGVVDYPIQMRSLSEAWRLARRLRTLEATTLIYLTPRLSRLHVLRDMLFFRFSGLKRIIGAPLAKDVQVITYDKQGLREMECVRLARSLRALGHIDLYDRKNWDLKLTPDEIAAGEAALAPFGGTPFIAINMGGKAVENHWGDANWRELFAQLAPTHGGYGLLFVGAGEEGGAVDRVVGPWPGPVINACGKLLPRESAAALKRASLFIGHDSGPMHLAAAVGVVCIAAFGSLNRPRKWHPWGPSHRVIHRLEGIDKIRPEEMAHEARSALAGRLPAGV